MRGTKGLYHPWVCWKRKQAARWVGCRWKINVKCTRDWDLVVVEVWMALFSPKYFLLGQHMLSECPVAVSVYCGLELWLSWLYIATLGAVSDETCDPAADFSRTERFPPLLSTAGTQAGNRHIHQDQPCSELRDRPQWRQQKNIIKPASHCVVFNNGS